MGYTKLFEELVRSSVWREDNQTRIVWITLLALKDRNHFVRGDDRYLAAVANVSIEDFQKAVGKLSGPDPNSHLKNDDGARIRMGDGGWFIINGEHYAKKLSAAERAEYNRQKQAEYRKRKKEVANAGACAGATKAINEAFKI